MRDRRSKTDVRHSVRCGLVFLCLVSQGAWAGGEPAKAAGPQASVAGGIEDPCLSDKPCSDLYKSAQVLSKNGQYAAAVSNYESAYRMHRMPWLLVNIGRVHQKSGNPKAAIASYERYFAAPESDREASTNAKAREYLRQAEEDLKRAKGPTVIREREVNGPRPLWRILTGTGLIALGAAGLGMGIAGLAINGTCVESVPSAMECRQVYSTIGSGAGLLIAGGLAAAGGVVLLALPGQKAVVQVVSTGR